MSLIVALILGIGHDIENELAYQLGKKGICVAYYSKNGNNLDRIAKLLNDEDIQSNFIRLETADNVIQRLDDEFGKLDVLINVGILLDNGQFKINLLTAAKFEANDFFDTLHTSEKFIPLLQKSPSSSVINVYTQTKGTSLSGLVQNCTSKMAEHQFTNQFNKSFANTSITIHSVTLDDNRTVPSIQDEANRIIGLALTPFIEPSKTKSMRILYGIVGEGLGHVTRSKVTLELLMKEGHHVKVVVSNRAYKFLDENFSSRYPRCSAASPDEAAIDIIEIEGLTMQYVNNIFDEKASVRHTMQRLPTILNKNFGAYYRNLVLWRPKAVISDFDSFAYLFAKAHGLPILSIDNQHVVQRCVIPEEARQSDLRAFNTYKNFVKVKLPYCDHYIITGFFTPEKREKYKLKTTLVPPILRQAIIDARPIPAEQGEHFLVYQSSKSDTTLLSTLADFGEKCIVYGLGRDETIGNLQLKGFSEQGFIDDLAHAKGVIANGGLSLMNEAISLQRPFFSVPVENQYEQVLNAWYLQKLGYGMFVDKIEVNALREWSQNIPQYAKALSHYHHDSNLQLYKTVKRVLAEFSTRFIWWDPLNLI